nr:PREDICTED: THAP domain-containing protein 10-like isoform X2 [Latimeria chalumnae]|eukprot:XP_014346373.1 PREDICTED: THAP domain-containing protein 10-like isoform X2 [Latimeria chalumnae]
MPYCSAVGCKNGEGSGRSFFRFPKDKKMRKMWLAGVKKASSQGKRENWSPKKYSVLCSDHFSRSAFVTDPEIFKSLGLKRNLRLRPDAVPTIFTTDAPHAKSDATQKRRKAKDVKETMNSDLDDSLTDTASETELSNANVDYSCEEQLDSDASDCEGPSHSVVRIETHTEKTQYHI